MTDTIIWCCLCLAAGLWLGFTLAAIMAFGGVRKWKACGSAYKSGRVAVLQELYKQISERQKRAKGVEWSILNEVLGLIGAMLPDEIRKE